MTDFEEKYYLARNVIQEWVDKQGHNRCWYYPDLFNRLVEVYDIKLKKDPSLPPLDEFKKGCERYQKEEFERQK